MSKVKVGVAGFGVIGQRLADGIARQEDMELVGVADVAPTLAVRALAERGMPYRMFAAAPGAEEALAGADIPVSGGFDDLLDEVEIMLDAAPGGIGARNKEKYVEHGVKAVFQGGEAGEVADVFPTATPATRQASAGTTSNSHRATPPASSALSTASIVQWVSARSRSRSFGVSRIRETRIAVWSTASRSSPFPITRPWI